MSSLEKSFRPYIPDTTAPRLPEKRILDKLAGIDAELPYQILDQAIKTQSERHDRPKLVAEFEEALEKQPWQTNLRLVMERLGLSFLFKTKAQPKSDPPPQRIKRNMDSTKPAPLSKPAKFSLEEMAEDDFIIDFGSIGDDLRFTIQKHAEKDDRVQLDAFEKKSLQI